MLKKTFPSDTQTILRWMGRNLFVLVTAAVALINLLILNSLSPAFKDIAVLAQRVSALESGYTNINAKLDQLIFIHVGTK